MNQPQLPWPITDSPPPLGAGEVHVWSAPIDAACDAAWQLLSDDERRRAEQFLYPRPRDRFVAARAALRNVLSHYVAAAPAALSFRYGPYGKPSLASPTGVQFNMAHSAGLALIAVTGQSQLGIDIEALRPVRHGVAICQRFFHPAEVARIVDDDDFEASFFHCWTRKEAVLKAIGAGLQFPLQAFDVGQAHISSAVDVPAGRTNPASTCWLAGLEPGKGFVAALASVGRVEKLSCYSLPR